MLRRRRPPGSSTSGRASRSRSWSARRVRAEPGARARRARQARLVIWGDTAHEAYDLDRRGVQPGGRVRQPQDARARAVRRPERARRVSTPTQRRRRCARSCRRCAAPSRRERSKILHRRPLAGGARVRRLGARPPALQVGAACPDHLVHTKRLPLWVPYDPASDAVDELRERIVDGAAALPRASTRAYFERYRGAGDKLARSRPARGADRERRAGGVGPDAEGRAHLPRPLSPRDRGDGRRAARSPTSSRSTTAESFAIEYWPLELYKLSLAPPPGELQGKVALVTGAAGGIGARDRRRACRGAGACVVAFDIDADGAARRSRPLGDRRRRGRRRRHRRDVGRSTRTPRRSTPSAVSTSSSPTPASPRARRSARRRWPSGTATSHPRPGYFLVAREAFRVLRAQGVGGAIVFVASKNALVAGQNAAAYSTAKAAELHLARCLAEEGGAARHPRQHRQPRRGAAGLADLGLELARGARRRLRDRARTSSRSTTASAPMLGVNVLPEDIAAGGPALRLVRPAPARAPATC